MSDLKASAAAEHLMFDDIRSKLEDILAESSEKHSSALTPEEIDAILERLESEVNSDSSLS